MHKMEKQKMVNQGTTIYVHFHKLDGNGAKFFSRIVELTILSRKSLYISENAHFECPVHLPGVHKMEKQKMVNHMTTIYVHFHKLDGTGANFFSRIVELKIMSRK